MININLKKSKRIFIIHTIIEFLFILSLFSGYLYIIPENSINIPHSLYVLTSFFGILILTFFLIDKVITIKKNIIDKEMRDILRGTFHNTLLNDEDLILFEDYRLNTFYYKIFSIIQIIIIVIILLTYLFISDTNYISLILFFIILNYLLLNFFMNYYKDIFFGIILLNKITEITEYTDKGSFIKLMNLSSMSKKIRYIYPNGHVVALEFYLKKYVEQILFNKEYQNTITYEIMKLEEFINLLNKDFKGLVKNKKDIKAQSSMKDILDICLSLQTNLINSFDSIKDVDINTYIKYESEQNNK